MNNRLIEGLSTINDTTLSPFASDSVEALLNYYLQKLSSILALEHDALCIARAAFLLGQEGDELLVLGGNDNAAEQVGKNANTCVSSQILTMYNHCIDAKANYYSGQYNFLYMCHGGIEGAIYFRTREAIGADARALAETLASQMSIALENINLYRKLKKTSFNDWLTRLPNRNEFINLISQSKLTALSQNIALVDLKHFSDVNDGLGQDIGNSLLIAVANRLKNSFDSDVHIGRVTADVFGIVGDANFVDPFIINDLFRTPFSIGVHTLQVNVSVGMHSVAPNIDAIFQLRCANVALNHAKQSLTSNYSFYSPAMDEETKERLEIIRNLQHDFDKEKLEVWYQPQVNLHSGELIGLEALLRWRNAKGEFVSPEVFVPLAEYSGSIVDIGKWVLAEAIRRMKMLATTENKPLRMAVNVSLLQFRDPEFVPYVKYILDIHGVTPSLLELEVTESVVMDEPEIVIQSLNELKNYGISIAIDDFGTGFSSLSYIQQMPLDRLKIDKSFVQECGNRKNEVISQVIVNLGQQLGLTTIAEGVENKEQVRKMIALGAQEAQGYYFARPMSFDKLRSYLASSMSAEISKAVNQ
ncbi:EAL domain-containing protein [Glaciecola sp. MH2013]|uniref:bifunctional diguanylate cyclase/phosphodiesterase n=1 Tax=Glaciecola sp. MH2013 TaxID=2785524 RepID=UPI00189DCC5D|nr:EAL domain-containing protein [Glaciecola sp. MH2013]MBF7074970.1 EAL domain-containing protein [Glaciecola sp. MH2013]